MPAEPSPSTWIAANRLPVIWDHREGWTRSPGGYMTALEAVVRRRRAGWVGSWSGNAAAGAETRPPAWPHGPLVGVDTPVELRTDAVDGVCNTALWPALHGLSQRVVWRTSLWPQYEDLNGRFADVLRERTEPGDLVWVHDYHLLLVPGLLAGLDRTVAMSLHTPLDVDGLLEIPTLEEILASLATADVVGVQTERDADALALLLSRSDVAPDDHPAVVVSPVAVDTEALRRRVADPPTEALRRRLRERHRGRRLLVGVDRLDHAKGIVERLQALDIALRRRWLDPETMQVILVLRPSRVQVPAYRRLWLEAERLVHDLSVQWQRADGSSPFDVRFETADPREVTAMLAAADVCMVTPIRDGMGLVAKEFSVVGRDEAALLLSRGAGAHDELGRYAVSADGDDPHSIAAGIHAALQLEPEVRRTWSAARRDVVERWTAQDWATSFLERCGRTSERAVR